MPETVEIKRKKGTDNIFTVKMDISHGKILAILHALRDHPTPVGIDINRMIQDACDKVGIA